MRLIIPDHAVAKFVRHIYDEPTDYIPNSLERMARDEITDAAENPDLVYHGKPDMPPIHIKGRIAVVVDGSKGGEDGTLVPTVYPRGTFIDTDETERKREPEPV